MGVWDLRCTKLMVFGITTCFFGGLLALTWAPLHDYFSVKELTLHPGSTSFRNWKTPPVPMHMDFYLFNWTNSEKLTTEKPRFEELGPYRYIEKRKKVNITWNENGTVTYRNLRYWYFSPELSNGTEEDMVTTLNGVAVAAARKVMNARYLSQKTVSVALSATRQELATTRQVKELLFDGYEDTLITLGRSLSSGGSPYDKFGWFYMRNGSYKYDGTFNINTGVLDIGKLGVLEQWNYKNRTKFYSGNCANIYGGSGDLYPPHSKTRESTVSLYSADICRSLTMTYARDDEVKGVPVYRYEVDPKLLDNGTRVEGNECFCNGECVPSGLLNLTQCRYGVPAFVSFPHFLHADPFYLRQVDGLSPDPKKHTFYMSVEPTMGFPLDIAARIQVNLLLQPATYVSLFKEVPTVFFPVLWVEQKFELPNEVASSLRLARMLPSIGYTVAVVLFFFGLGTVLATLAFRKSTESGSGDSLEKPQQPSAKQADKITSSTVHFRPNKLQDKKDTELTSS